MFFPNTSSIIQVLVLVLISSIDKMIYIHSKITIVIFDVCFPSKNTSYNVFKLTINVLKYIFHKIGNNSGLKS